MRTVRENFVKFNVLGFSAHLFVPPPQVICVIVYTYIYIHGYSSLFFSLLTPFLTGSGSLSVVSLQGFSPVPPELAWSVQGTIIPSLTMPVQCKPCQC